MKELQEKIRAAWAERQPRERLFLVALTAFIVCALLVQGIWSARSEGARLRKQVPQLRLQAETMHRQSAEIRQLQAQAKAAGAAALEGAALLAAAGTAAKVSDLGLEASQLQLEGPRQLRLRATLSFDRWIAWAATVQADLRLRVVRCQIDKGEVPGRVKIDALFAVPDPA